MLLNVHPKTIIWYKMLSDADLWISPTSHQTHIWLYEDTLNILWKNSRNGLSYFVYEDNLIQVPSFLDWIDNPDGSRRSPKIRKWHDDEISLFDWYDTSLVKKIRNIAKWDQDSRWALFWFSLEDESILFYLVKIPSQAQREIENIIWPIHDRWRIASHDWKFAEFLTYLGRKLEDVTIWYEKALELAIQTGETNLLLNSPIKQWDIDNIKKNVSAVWRLWEELINNYFDILKKRGEILSYERKNKSFEMWLPFDFEFRKTDWNIYYTDVKSTQYEFEQKMIFSNHELKFIEQMKDYYFVHRVYWLKWKNPEPKLKILSNMQSTSWSFFQKYNSFQRDLQTNSMDIFSIKIAVSPTSIGIKKSDEIFLSLINKKFIWPNLY